MTQERLRGITKDVLPLDLLHSFAILRGISLRSPHRVAFKRPLIVSMLEVQSAAFTTNRIL
jgi:hypothetical protein